MIAPTFRDAQEAFADAIKAGLLSGDPAHTNYAGRYMYMFTDGGADHFKDKITRKYIRNEVTA